jgi:hypothetical protein
VQQGKRVPDLPTLIDANLLWQARKPACLTAVFLLLYSCCCVMCDVRALQRPSLIPLSLHSSLEGDLHDRPCSFAPDRTHWLYLDYPYRSRALPRLARILFDFPESKSFMDHPLPAAPSLGQ